MELTPLDIHHKEFHRAIRGYNEEEVDVFLDKVADSFERLFNENRELKEQTDKMKDKVSRYEGLEQTMQKAILTAQQAADEVQSSAAKEAELIVKDAELKAREIVQDIDNQKRNIHDQLESLKNAEVDFRENFKSLLQEYLGTIKKMESGDIDSEITAEEAAPDEVDETEEEKIVVEAEETASEEESDADEDQISEQAGAAVEDNSFEEDRTEFREEVQLEKEIEEAAEEEENRESAASAADKRIPATDTVSTEELYQQESEISEEEPTVFIPPPVGTNWEAERSESGSHHRPGPTNEASESGEEERKESASTFGEEKRDEGFINEKKTQDLENFFDNSSFFEDSKKDDKRDEDLEAKQSGPDLNSIDTGFDRDASSSEGDLLNKSSNDSYSSNIKDSHVESSAIDYSFPEPGGNEKMGTTEDVSTFFDDDLGSE